MDDALLRQTLARLMRERVPEADEQAKEEEEPSVMQLSQERYLIHQMIAEVKAELADEELEVKEEITDADILQKWCQPVSSSSAADADASNAAASSAADADASKEEPEADEEADGNKEELETEEADGNKEEPETDEEGHGEFAQSTHSQPTSQADACKEEPEADEGAVQAHADAPNAAAHADALKAWEFANAPWRRASTSSVGDQQAASSSGNAQRGSDNADRLLTSGLKRPSVDESPPDRWCADPWCQEALVSAECSFCTVHCEWRWPTEDAPLCKVHWDFPQRCKTPQEFCTVKHPDDYSCVYCGTHCPDKVLCRYHRWKPVPSKNKSRGKRATARYNAWCTGGWRPAPPPKSPWMPADYLR